MSFRMIPAAAAAAVALSLAASSTVHAADRAARAKPSVATKAAARTGTVASGGMRVYIDPDSGEHLPQPASPAHRAIASELPYRDDNKMRQEVIPGVGVLLHTNGQMRMTSFVRRGADGGFVEECLPSAAPAGASAPDAERAQ